jgi:hypothetical protein
MDRYSPGIARRLTLAAAFLALGGSISIAAPPEATLADGKHVVQFLQAGTTLKYTTDGPIEEFLRQNLPTFLAMKLDKPLKFELGVKENPAGQPCLFFLFRMRNPEGLKFHEVMGVFSTIEIEDSHGFVYQSITPMGGSSVGFIQTYVESFPRRDAKFRAKCYEAQSRRVLFDVEVDNPLPPAVIPQWEVESLPVSKTSGPVTVQLKGLHVETGKWIGPTLPGGQFNREIVVPDTEVTLTDLKWRKHQVHVELEDATGNRTDGQILSPFEPSWKLRLSLRREKDAEFDATEQWTLDPVPSPLELEAQPINLKKEVDGIPLEVAFVSSAGSVGENGSGGYEIDSPPARSMAMAGPKGGAVSTPARPRKSLPFKSFMPQFVFFQPREAAYDLIAVVTDQLGRVLSSDVVQLNPYKDRWWRSVAFRPLPDTKTVQLKIIANRSRDFEFVVKPVKAGGAKD